MCGIFAAIHQESVTQSLIQGLSQLTYRGYDSAGIAVTTASGVQRQRAQGKLDTLCSLLSKNPLEGAVGIAHTRWATHGLPNVQNAHPHMTEAVALVHNGIVENYAELKLQLQAEGFQFESDTDSETIAQLLTLFVRQGQKPFEALRNTLANIEGSYALAVIFHQEPNTLYVARQGSPLVIGQTRQGFFVSSDENALCTDVESVAHLQDGEMAVLQQDHVQFFDANGVRTVPQFASFDRDHSSASKQGYEHFMLKEIHEQTAVFERCWHSFYDVTSSSIDFPQLDNSLSRFSRISIIACGTSYYAGAVAKYWIEQTARVPVDLDIASEFRYRGAPLDAQGAALFISQSGETADTLAALQHAKSQGLTCIAMVNVMNSTMAREADIVLPTLAGPEIGVASTKAFMSQLTGLMMFTFALAKANGVLSKEDEASLYPLFSEFSRSLDAMLTRANEIEHIAGAFDGATSALFLGRGFSSALACEGALKLKEISYIHAEAYAAGELKHGPLALVDDNMPVVLIAPPDALFGKTLSNLREVAARGGKIILLSDAKGISDSWDFIEHGFEIPETHPMLQALLYTVPLQLLSYHCALRRGTDVDQPRNLAKSVTVE